MAQIVWNESRNVHRIDGNGICRIHQTTSVQSTPASHISITIWHSYLLVMLVFVVLSSECGKFLVFNKELLCLAPHEGHLSESVFQGSEKREIEIRRLRPTPVCFMSCV